MAMPEGYDGYGTTGSFGEEMGLDRPMLWARSCESVFQINNPRQPKHKKDNVCQLRRQQ